MVGEERVLPDRPFDRISAVSARVVSIGGHILNQPGPDNDYLDTFVGLGRWACT